MDWEEAQKLYEQLIKSRGDLAWLRIKNDELKRIRDEAAKEIQRMNRT